MSDLSFIDGFTIGRSRCKEAEKSGKKPKRIDWVKLDTLIANREIKEIKCWLSGDKPCTEQVVYSDGKKNFERWGGYFGSKWATPMVEIDGDEEECFVEADSEEYIDWSKPWPFDERKE